MFLKVIVVVDENHSVKNLNMLLDALHTKVLINRDLQILDGQVADSLAHSAPVENIHSKLIIDATIPAESDPDDSLPNTLNGISNEMYEQILNIDEVEQAKLLRPSILVITTKIENSPDPNNNIEEADNVSAAKQRKHIYQLTKTIWQLDNSNAIRWLFITDDDLDLSSDNANRTLLWQLFCRFEVSRDLHFDNEKSRVAWDATSPIPCEANSGENDEVNLPVRRWPAITLHDEKTQMAIDEMAKEEGWAWY